LRERGAATEGGLLPRTPAVENVADTLVAPAIRMREAPMTVWRVGVLVVLAVLAAGLLGLAQIFRGLHATDEEDPE